MTIDDSGPSRTEAPPRPSIRQRLAAAARIPLQSKIAVAIGAAAVIYVVVALLVVEHHPPKPPPPPKQGTACPYLFQASQATGDAQLFLQLAQRASEVGEATLQRTGESFGVAEETAFELGSLAEHATPTSAEITALLSKAEAACTKFGLWHE
jgi:hypothetical protein